MKIRIISVGKIKEKYFVQAIEEYKKRLSAYTEVEFIEVPDEKIPFNASLKEEEIVKRKEGEKVLSKIKDTDYIILLDVYGKQDDSVTFAKSLQDKMTHGISAFTFVIGGSLGLSDELRKRANEKMSLSKMTFTHQFTKVILLEQIYRAFKINNNETYHK